MHLEAGLPRTLGTSWHVKSTLMGCKHVFGDTHRPKLPITRDLLKAIFSQLDQTELMHVVFWAACLAAFFSFLCKSNMFVQGLVGHRPSLDGRMFPFYCKVLLSPFTTARPSKIKNTS